MLPASFLFRANDVEIIYNLVRDGKTRHRSTTKKNKSEE